VPGISVLRPCDGDTLLFGAGDSVGVRGDRTGAPVLSSYAEERDDA
jgi:hypothetical protein